MSMPQPFDTISARSDCRSNEDRDQSILEHRRLMEVDGRVGKYVKGRRKADAEKLVEELHHGADACFVWRALSTGCVDKAKYGGSPLMTFAGLCYARGRLDILRAVHQAGVPEWLKAIPKMDDPVTQFMTLKFPLVDDSSPQGWLHALTSFQTWISSENTHKTSLYRIAVEPIGKHSEDFLKFALEVDPRHPDIEDMQARSPEGHALLVQLQMRAHILASEEGCQPHLGPPGPRRLRACL
jgi:hypothetical protein